jgi:hypothetical protein
MRQKARIFGLSQGLAFPCPYGYVEDNDPAQEALRQWYTRTLGAQRIGRTPLMRFALTADVPAVV